jgi:cell wall-associated NlpC family hydrolase
VDDYTGVSYLSAVSRIAQIEQLLGQPATPAAPAATPSAGTAQAPFAKALGQAAAAGATGGSDAGLRALAVAEREIGVTEQPPGSNDGPRIAQYRSAVAGSYAGAPWCAYFVSWAAAQAGAPIGPNGQGLGSVAGITDWARSTGRLTNDPQPGDLILFGTEHVGIVESVNADGTLTTVEGNASNGVNREVHPRSDATGFVRL